MKNHRNGNSAAEEAARKLYNELLVGWNARDAAAFAGGFAPNATMIGFDGSTIIGQAAVHAHLDSIFTHHQTPRYVAVVQDVARITEEVVLLRAHTGLGPNGQTDINPQLNAIQVLVASQQDGHWQIALFQNTPAQFHGHPERVQAISAELRRSLA